jgi:hypothetical protein
LGSTGPPVFGTQLESTALRSVTQNQQLDLAPVRLLWTRGWDSTFRLLAALLIERRAVRPFYMVDGLRHRPGVPEERQAMRRIRQLIAHWHPEAAPHLLPTSTAPSQRSLQIRC